MKRILFLTLTSFFILNIYAQNEEDALRFSRQFLTGTARSVGMGGAMGAIGGDFSSLSINPAGIGVYRGNEFTFSPSLNWNTTESDYLGSKIGQTRYGIRVGNIGLVFTNKNDEDKGLVSTSFGIGYNQLNNFNRQMLMSGTSTSGSLLDHFTGIYNDPSMDISDFYEGLANELDLVAWDSAASEYFNDFERGGYGQMQQRRVSSSGHAGEFTFSAGANYSNRFYFGATLGIQRVRFEHTLEHTESDQANNIDFTEEFEFWEDLLTRGYGFNMKIGTIIRPVDFVRLGASFHLPVLYFLNDRFSSDMSAWYDPSLDIDPASAFSPEGNFDYTLKTPSKLIGSAAITLGKFGLISMDYERINYSSASLEGPDYTFIPENTAIEDIYQAANNFHFGAELRFGTNYLRGGYALYGSPLKFPDPSGDLKYSVISGGIGMRKSDYFMDLSYANGISKEAYYLYPGITNPAINSSNMNNFILTIGFRF